MKAEKGVTRFAEVEKRVREKVLSCGRRAEDVQVIAVSKGCSVASLQSTYHEGCRAFGESRIQEAAEKMPVLPPDCLWHLIGSLQRNKVVKAVGSFSLIHSVDTLQLAEKISAVSQDKGVVSSVLLQVNTSGEKTKHGLSRQQWEPLLDAVNALPNLRIEGLMTIAPLSQQEQEIRSSFHLLYELRERWSALMREPALFHHLSMGMSHDYPIAIEEGATLLRIGAAIFGERS